MGDNWLVFAHLAFRSVAIVDLSIIKQEERLVKSSNVSDFSFDNGMRQLKAQGVFEIRYRISRK